MKSKIFNLFIFICITRALGLAFMPALLTFSPALLIILSPFIHHLILTSTMLEAYVFILIGSVISIFQCLIGFEFGREHGVKGIEWTQKHKLISLKKVEFIMHWLRVSSTFILLLIPGPVIAMLAGVSKLERKPFLWVMIPSQFFWILSCYFLGMELDVYLAHGKELIKEYWMLLTPILIMFFILQRRR